MATKNNAMSDKSLSSDSFSSSLSSDSEKDWLMCPTEIIDFSNNMETTDDAPKSLTTDDAPKSLTTDDAPKSLTTTGHQLQKKSSGSLTVQKIKEALMGGTADVARTKGGSQSPYKALRNATAKTVGTEERKEIPRFINTTREKKLPSTQPEERKSKAFKQPEQTSNPTSGQSGKYSDRTTKSYANHRSPTLSKKPQTSKQPEESKPQPAKKPEEATLGTALHERVVRVTKDPNHHSPTRQRKIQPREPEEHKPHTTKEPEDAGQTTKPSGQASKPSGQASKPSGQASKPSGQASKPSGQKKPSGPEHAGQITRPPPPKRTVSPIGSPCPQRNLPVHPYWSGKY